LEERSASPCSSASKQTGGDIRRPRLPERLTPIFDALASLTAQVTAPSSVRVLTIGVGPTLP